VAVRAWEAFLDRLPGHRCIAAADIVRYRVEAGAAVEVAAEAPEDRQAIFSGEALQ